MRLAWGMIFWFAAVGCAQSERPSSPGKSRDLAPFLEPYDGGAEPADLAGGNKPDLLVAGGADLAPPPVDLAVAGDLAHLPGSDPLIYVNEASTLYTVDPDTFELTTIGSFGVADEITDIAVRADDSLIACTRTGLYSVDLRQRPRDADRRRRFHADDRADLSLRRSAARRRLAPATSTEAELAQRQRR